MIKQQIGRALLTWRECEHRDKLMRQHGEPDDELHESRRMCNKLYEHYRMLAVYKYRRKAYESSGER